jgi:Fic family protein
MRSVGYAFTEVNPFSDPVPLLRATRGESSYVIRVRLMWAEMRDEVIVNFPAEPGLPADKGAYLAAVQDTYVRDAYNSLSIEGYHVTNELIELVASGNWDPEENEADLKSKDAMAARGYFLARQKVEESIRRIIGGENAGRVVAQDHRVWYRELFGPSVDAKLLKPSDLAGYRSHQVFIRNAAHVPPPKEAVRDMMPALFELLEAEPHAAARAVLGHFVFVFTHPYLDGNGRIGRFLMNAMLASGGYPWTVIEVSRRPEYMDALNAASSSGDIGPFVRFVASSLRQELYRNNRFI